MLKSLLLMLALMLPFTSEAFAVTSITVQSTTDKGLNYTAANAATTMSFFNDGNTTLVFVNGSVTARTLTVTVQTPSITLQGYNPITLSNTTVTIPGSGTNGGLAIVGPFAKGMYNDSSGLVQIAIDAVTSLTVSAISSPKL